jgi:hypothetical protein
MKKLLAIFALVMPALSLAAFDFEGSGFAVSGSSVPTGSSIVLVDESGASLGFTAEAEPTAARIKALRAIVAEIRSWKNITVADLSAINNSDGLQVSITPKIFTAADGTSLAEAVPGGIQLFYDTATEYDFKVKSGRYVMRLRSIYTSEEDMESLALRAFKDPAAFLETQDPIYLFKRIEDLEAKNAALAAKEAALEAQVVADATKSADLAQRTRRALLTALNGNHPINQAALDKLVELKNATPGLTKADALKQLKAAKISMSNQEILAVFLVDFGENQY